MKGITLPAAELDEALAALHFTDRLLRPSGDGLHAFDMECRYLFWNAAMERITGVSELEVLGRSAFEVFPFLRENGAERWYREALAGRAVASGEQVYAIASTGRRGFYEGFYSPLQLGSGKIAGGIAVIRDITQRKLAEQQVRETEARFQNMADAAPVLLWMSERDGLCTFFNRTWLEFTGRSLEEEWGVGWAEGVHFEDFQRCMDVYSAAFTRRETFEMEYRLRRADGAYRWVLDRGVPRYTPDGTFAGYIGSCIDITTRRAGEAALRDAVRLRDEFLSIASHELRTPLTALLLDLEGIERTLAKRPEEGLASGRLARRAQKAAVQGGRLSRLVEELLDISRISGGRLVLEPAEVDLAAVARDVAGRFSPLLAAARCPLALRADTPVWGRWDRSRVEQVITNLLDNARKYGAGTPVELSVEGDEREGRLVVSDRGIGIAPEQQARIFERFERAVDARHYGGLGLGLWITRQIIEAHGGTLAVSSAPGAGATFTVVLPRGQANSVTG